MATPLRAPLAGLLAGFLLTLGAVLLPAVPAQAASHAVTIHNYAYGPGSLSITQGDTVTWTNHDTAEHDVVVTSGPASFRSPMLSKGESWSYTFTTAGNYGYTCSVHPDMRGSVSAKAAAPPPAPDQPTSAQPDPAQQPPAAPPANQQQTAPAVPAPTVPTTVPTTKKGKHGHQAAATSTPAAVPAAVPSTTAAAPASQPSATLDPLLLVAGVSVAVVVFCLLLMASRPQPVALQGQTPTDPKDMT